MFPRPKLLSPGSSSCLSSSRKEEEWKEPRRIRTLRLCSSSRTPTSGKMEGVEGTAGWSYFLTGSHCKISPSLGISPQP